MISGAMWLDIGICAILCGTYMECPPITRGEWEWKSMLWIRGADYNFIKSLQSSI